MEHQQRRYVFTTLDDLLSVRFKRLQKVCDRLFVFLGDDIREIPVELVVEAQRMGKNLKWILLPPAPNRAQQFPISFLMGSLHKKVNEDIEFAILSNDEDYDTLVTFINHSGRNCLRIKQQSPHLQDEFDSEEQMEIDLAPSNGNQSDYPTFPSGAVSYGGGNDPTGELAGEIQRTVDREAIQHAASETVRRLIRSGNRPSDLSMLKSYILMHNQEDHLADAIDVIIEHMEETNEIQVDNEEVVYNF